MVINVAKENDNDPTAIFVTAAADKHKARMSATVTGSAAPAALDSEKIIAAKPVRYADILIPMPPT